MFKPLTFNQKNSLGKIYPSLFTGRKWKSGTLFLRSQKIRADFLGKWWMWKELSSITIFCWWNLPKVKCWFISSWSKIQKIISRWIFVLSIQKYAFCYTFLKFLSWEVKYWYSDLYGWYKKFLWEWLYCRPLSILRNHISQFHSLIAS